MGSLEKPNMRMLLDPGHCISLGFGSGLSPFAPGTVGSLVAVPLAFYIHMLQISYRLLILAILILAGIYLCDRSSKLFKSHDHSSIVFDEIIGMLIPIIFLPFTFANILICFCMFRFFDILKPWPVSFFDESLKGGLGIMADDLAAGLLTLLFVLFLFRVAF